MPQVITRKMAGARPLIQSQWTCRPSAGFTKALRPTIEPTTTAAHAKEVSHPRCGLDVASRDFAWVPWCLGLTTAPTPGPGPG